MRNRFRPIRSSEVPTLVAPPLTHLQYFTLFQIAGGVRKGKAIRAALGQEEVSQKLPTFHAFMARLERAGLISGKYVTATGGARGREREYGLTPAGRKALKEVGQFYSRLQGLAGE